MPSNKAQRWSKLSVILVLASLLMLTSGCGWFKKDEPPPPPPPPAPEPTPPPEPTRIEVKFETAGNINPNMTGHAAPVLVRIYQLKSYPAFDKADFVSLYEKGSETLANDLVYKEEIYLKPNEKRTIFFEVSEETKALGILAAFRHYQSGQWKVSLGIEPNKTNVINIFISDVNVQIK